MHQLQTTTKARSAVVGSGSLPPRGDFRAPPVAKQGAMTAHPEHLGKPHEGKCTN